VTIQTRCCFYYDFEITELNYAIDLDEGGGELQASLRQGFYTLEDLAVEAQRALNASGGTYNYFVGVDRDSRLLTISEENSNTFSLLWSTGSRTGINAGAILSFSDAADLSGASTYTGTLPTGKVFEPQFLLQSYVDEENYQESISATRNESSAGIVEVCRFGTRKYVEFNITFQNNGKTTCGSPIEESATGYDDLVEFMKWVTKIGGVEMMKDRDNKLNYISLLIEKTPLNSRGTGYKLKELYTRGLPGFYETGVLRFRLQEGDAC